MISARKFRHLRRGLEYFRKYTSQASTAEFYEDENVKTVKKLELDEKVASDLENRIYHPKKHPGVFRKKTDGLPLDLENAMQKILQGHKPLPLVKEGKKLCRQLWGRHFPPEKQDYVQKLEVEKLKAETAINELDSNIDDKLASEIEEKIVTKQLQDIIHPWHPLNVTPETCLQYFISRTPAEYCVLHKILSEIQQTDPEFVPLTLFDFGSGIASGYWAVREVWKKPLKEVYNVDTNLNMNKLAQNILHLAKHYDENTQTTAEKGIFFRQFFPFSHERTYDIVLSAFTLLELPSFKERVEAVAHLWSKTENYLVIVEDGSNAGYKAVMEARNLVIHLETPGENDTDKTEAYVASPCPHEFVCPRFTKDNTPCNFEVNYLTPQFLEGKQVRQNHRYSYVVFKKGQRPADRPQWSRCVRESLLRNKHIHLHLCTPDGNIENGILFKQNNCRNAYRCAKYTSWGDLLPGKIKDHVKDENKKS